MENKRMGGFEGHFFTMVKLTGAPGYLWAPISALLLRPAVPRTPLPQCLACVLVSSTTEQDNSRMHA